MIYDIKSLFIKTKTNLLVGEGSTTYDIVDNAVQRDSISHLPIINASSLKGALKDFMIKKVVKNSDDIHKLEEEGFNKLFGSDDKQQGIIKFLDSYLLFLPLRSNKKPYFHTTSKQNLLQFVDFFETLGCKENFSDIKSEIDNIPDDKDMVLNDSAAYVEDYSCKSEPSLSLNTLLNLFPEHMRPENIAILSDENFLDAIQHLPVIARNRLENGESKNLWYEEIVPRESIFYTAMLDYNNFGVSSKYKYEKGFQAFYNILQNNLIQVGSNASIGYGLCDFKQFLECRGEE